MTIWQLSRMTHAERTTYVESGGTVIYPASFWVLCVIGALSAWFIYEVITRPPSPAQIERRAESQRESDAEEQCFLSLRKGAKNPSTFEVDYSGVKKNEGGYLAQINFSSANAFNVRFEYSGVCQVVDGKVTAVRIFKR